MIKEQKENTAIQSTLTTKNEESIEEVFVRDFPQLKKYISKRLPADGHPDVDDIIQEAFVRAYSSKKKQKLKFATAYLYKIVRNLVFERQRKPQNHVNLALEDLAAEGIINNLKASERCDIEANRLKEVTNTLAELPPKCRQVFYMRHFSGMSYAEIGDAMNISNSTVEKHLSKGLYIITKKLHNTVD